MKRKLLAGWIVMTAAAAFATPFPAAEVAAGAKWVLHADLDLFKQTSLGGQFLAELSKEQHARKLDALEAILGLDIRRQLSGWTMYGFSGQKQDAIILASGTFDSAQFTKLLKANENYSSTLHGGFTIHGGRNDKGEDYFVVFPASGRAVIGSRVERVKEALEVIAGGRPSLARENLSGLPLESAAGHAFFMAGAMLNELKNTGPKAQTLRIARSGALSLGEEGRDMVAVIDLDAESAEDAQHLQDAARGLLALTLLDEKHDAGTRDALRNTQIELKGTRLHVALRVPSEKMMEGIRKSMEKRAQAGTGRQNTAP